MSSFRRRAAFVLAFVPAVVPAFLAAWPAAAAGDRARETAYPGIGRPATASELAAWDIDVRPDFKGLPKGSGSVAEGQRVWDAKCAGCHGVFGESNEVFSPLVGGTSADDVRTGRVARLQDPAFPTRSTLMKVATVSTLWDYIRRAMPWNAPKSLAVDEVYAATAYLLNLGGIVPDDFTLSDTSIAAVQERMPNRRGTTTAHALWPGRWPGAAPQRPDVRAAPCMVRCRDAEPALRSSIPDFARDAHGNLALQNRLVGAQHGADTTRPAGSRAPAAPAASDTPAALAGGGVAALARKHNCLACHGIDSKLVGPALREVSRKVAGRADAAAYLAQKIRSGGVGAWGTIAMPAQTLPDSDLATIAQWLADGATN